MPSPSFHKLIQPSTLQAKQLGLPDDFVKKYGGSMSSIVTLTVPDGSVWRVGLKKEDNKFWFGNGWHEFVENYSIGTGCLLIFRYEGKSSFIVNIYGFASEINYNSPAQSSNKAPHFAKNLEILEDLADEDSIEMMHLSPTKLTHSPLQNKAVSGSADKFTPGKSHSPPALQMTRDIGLQFNVVEFKKSTEEVKLRTATDKKVKKTVATGEKIKKTATKKRKSDVQEPPSEHEDEVEMHNR